MSGATWAAEVIRFDAFVWLTALGSRFALWLSRETGGWGFCVRVFVAVLVAKGLGYF
jgi:hypothetical protein